MEEMMIELTDMSLSP